MWILRCKQVAITALVLLFATPAIAADNVLAQAKKEGKVVWYSSLSLPIAQEVCNAYNAKHTGIECVLHRSGSGKLYTRWRNEAKSGIYEADVIHTSNIGHFVSLRDAKAIIQYAPKGIERYNPNFVEKNHYWAVLRASVYTPAYNTSQISEADAPKTWKDLLDPKWTGKMVQAHPAYSGFVSVGIAALVKTFGWDYIDKLAKLKPRIVQSVVDTTSYIVRGESLLGATGYYNDFDPIKAGEPIKAIFPPEGVPFIASAEAIFTKAPHPNAAKVFTDWLFSTEAQQILVNHGLYSGDPDVKYPPGVTPLDKLKLIVLSPEEAVKMRDPVRKHFREVFGV
jgi:iron(III) transport system substrate-binding protein